MELWLYWEVSQFLVVGGVVGADGVGADNVVGIDVGIGIAGVDDGVGTGIDNNALVANIRTSL